MKVLIACEFSGIVREAFRKKGHDAYSCDILDSEKPSIYHIKDNVLNVLNDEWDLMVAHPSCQFICNSGVWALKDPERWIKLKVATTFFNKLQNAPIEKICIENPVPHKYAVADIGKYSQTIQPYQFGEDASKRTCLWLKNLPLLKPTKLIKLKQYANQTKSGQNKLSPGPDRWKERSRTYQGIADAMADQWG